MQPIQSATHSRFPPAACLRLFTKSVICFSASISYRRFAATSCRLRRLLQNCRRQNHQNHHRRQIRRPRPKLLPPPPLPPLFMNMPSKNQTKPPPPALDNTERTIRTITIPRRMAPADGPLAGRSSGGGRGGSGPSSFMPASAAITPATRCVMSSNSRAVLVLPEQRNGLTTKAAYFPIRQDRLKPIAHLNSALAIVDRQQD